MHPLISNDRPHPIQEIKVRMTGAITLLIGVIGLVASMFIDTSVASGELGNRVHNIGLMNDKQNLLLLFAVVSIVGTIFCALGSRGTASTGSRVEVSLASSHRNRRCPFCAESIQTEAIICRFCQRELPTSPSFATASSVWSSSSRSPLEITVDTTSDAGCVATLGSMGFLVSNPAKQKWEVAYPKSGMIAYAYSTEDLQALTLRAANERAIREQA